MAFRLTPWIGLTLAGCAAAALALLPPQEAYSPWAFISWRPRASATLEQQLRRAYNLRWTLATRDTVMRELRMSRATDRHLTILTGRGVPAQLGDGLRRAFQPLSDSPDAGAASTRLVLAVRLDTTARTSLTPGELYPGAIDWNRPAMNYSVVLPEATDGRVCLVLVSIHRGGWERLRASGVPHDTVLLRSYWWRLWDEEGYTSLLGPCAYYSAFGMPGSAVSAWLESADYVHAGRAGWIQRRTEPAATGIPRAWWRPASWWRLEPRLEACAAGSATRCREALFGPVDAGWSLRRSDFEAAEKWSVPGVVNLGRLQRYAPPGLGRWADRYLSDLVDDIGPERFARFWRSQAPVDRAFQEAAGMTIETWTMQWARRYLGVTPQGPTPTPATTVTAIILAAVVLAAGAAYTMRRQVA